MTNVLDQLEDFKIIILDKEKLSHINQSRLYSLKHFKPVDKVGCFTRVQEVNMLLEALEYLYLNTSLREIDVNLIVINMRIPKLKVSALVNICSSLTNSNITLNQVVQSVKLYMNSESLVPLIQLLINLNHLNLLKTNYYTVKWLYLIVFYKLQACKDFPVVFLEPFEQNIMYYDYSIFVEMTILSKKYGFSNNAVFWKMYNKELFSQIQKGNIEIFKLKYNKFFEVDRTLSILIYYALIYYELPVGEIKEALSTYLLCDLEGENMRLALAIRNNDAITNNSYKHDCLNYLFKALHLVCTNANSMFLYKILTAFEYVSATDIIVLIDMINNCDSIVNKLKYLYELSNVEQACRVLEKYIKGYNLTNLLDSTHLYIKSIIYLSLSEQQ